MTSRLLTTAACALAIFTAVTNAQVPGRDQRIVPAGAAKGSAELSVVVTTDESNSRPLRRVSVALQQGEIDIPNIAVTDDDGRAVFRGLVAGNYTLTAMRTGFVRTFYGSKLPGRGPGIAVTVLEGQRVPDVRIRMMRGAVITGTIRTAGGKPAQYQAVQAVMVRSSGGERRATNLEAGLGGGLTDDRGVYRLFGLAPGDYIVLVPSGVVGGEDLRQMTAEEIRWADGVVAGGATTAPPSGMPPAPPGAAPVAPSPVYFPGTAVAADAALITLGPGEERAGTDFGLMFVPTAQISGRVIDSDGRPQMNVSVLLKPLRSDGMDLFSSLFNANGRTGADGTFTIRGVKPGGYTLSVRATPTAGPETAPASPQEAMARAQQQAAAMMGGGGGTHWAAEEISVQGRDVSDLTLTLRPGMTISGKIVYEATTKTPPTDLSKSGLTLMTAPTGNGLNDMVGALMGSGSTPLAVAADGTFTIKGVAPGRYRINSPLGMMATAGVPTMAPSSGGFTLKSVIAGGRDVADSVLDVKPGADVSSVVISFTDQPAELSGTVFDGAGRATPEFPIIVFSTDRGYWTLGSRRVQTAHPSSDGKYRITLPAGEYFVSAVTAVDRTEVYDPQFLNQLTGVAFRITIKDGEKKTQDLKLGGGF